MRDLVKICEPGQTILDPFCGSGTTLVASIQEGYSAVGIEVTPEYATVAQNQIADALNNPAPLSNNNVGLQGE